MHVEEGGLGDLIHNALEKVGITPQLVEEWVGGPCGCEERRIRLNSLSAWASRIISGRLDRAKDILSRIMGE